MDRNEALDALAAGKFAFLDLGSGRGGSIEHCELRFKRSPGLGFEADEALVREAQAAGLAVVRADLREASFPPRCVAFTSMMDFLEHLPDERSAVAVLEAAARASRDFLFIRHPSFEERDYLASHGFKITWTDWELHPNMMTIADIRRIFASLGWRDYEIFPRQQILDSMDEAIVPLSAPRDTLAYDEALHGPKQRAPFDRLLFAQYDIFVRLNPNMPESAWREVLDSEHGTGFSHAGDSVGVFSPGTSMFQLRYWTGDLWAHHFLQYGAAGSGLIPFVGDFDGDGMDGIGVYDPAHGAFFLKNSPAQGAGDLIIMFGPPGGYPVAGDWDGTGTDTIGVYVESAGRFFLRSSNAPGPADLDFSFGPEGAGVIPVVGDWDGDGRDSVGVYDPRTGTFFLKDSGPGKPDDSIVGFGGPHALPVVGDWNGDGRDTIGLYVPDTGDFLLRNENRPGEAEMTLALGVTGGLPVAGRWSAPAARRRRART